MPKLARNAAIFLFFLFLQRAASFLLLPIYTANLSPTEYGVFSVILSLSQILAIVFLLSLNAPVVRFYHDDSSDEEYHDKLWTAILFIQTGAVVASSLFVVLFHKQLIDPFIGGASFFPYGILAVAIAETSTFFTLYQAHLQTSGDAKRFAGNNLTHFFLVAGMTIVMVVFFDLGAIGMLVPLLIANGVLSAYSIVMMISKIEFSIDVKVMRSVLAYSLPMLPHAITGWITGFMDRIFLAKWANPTEVGLYNLAYQASFVTMALAMAINQAFMPWFFEKVKSRDPDLNKVGQVVNIGIYGYLLLALVISSLMPEALRIFFVEAYWECDRFALDLSFSASLAGYYFFLSAPLFYDKSKAKRIFLITVGAASINVVGSIYVIPEFGAMGAGAVNLLGRVGLVILVGYFGSRITQIPVGFFKLSLLTLSGYGLAILFSEKLGVFSAEKFVALSFLIACYLAFVYAAVGSKWKITKGFGNA